VRAVDMWFGSSEIRTVLKKAFSEFPEGCLLMFKGKAALTEALQEGAPSGRRGPSGRAARGRR
jgi:hypothetical protein